MIILPRRIIEAREAHDPLKAVMSGRFTLQAVKDGRVVREREFDNIITNLGLDMWGSVNGSTIFTRMRVGTGTSAPSATDTQLQNQIGVEAFPPSPTNAAGVAPDYESSSTFVANWNVGEVVGNITEICIGRSGSTDYAFSRALILDGVEVPVAFPVAADEQLRATYVLKLYPPLVDQMTTQKIGSVTHDVLVRAYNLTSGRWSPYSGFSQPPTISTQNAYTGGPIASLVSSATPTGALGPLGNVAVAYANGSYRRRGNATAGPTEVNGNIRTIVNTRAQMGFQNEYTPPIVKTSVQTLVIPSEVAWSRR